MKTLVAAFIVTVLKVYDGDTLKVCCFPEDKGKVATVTLARIDAPELRQPLGETARSLLVGLVGSKKVTVKVYLKDKDLGYISDVYYNNHFVNHELLRYGLAWVCYPKDKRDVELQTFAENIGIGIWALPNPIPPWEFRKRVFKK